MSKTNINYECGCVRAIFGNFISNCKNHEYKCVRRKIDIGYRSEKSVSINLECGCSYEEIDLGQLQYNYNPERNICFCSEHKNIMYDKKIMILNDKINEIEELKKENTEYKLNRDIAYRKQFTFNALEYLLKEGSIKGSTYIRDLKNKIYDNEWCHFRWDSEKQQKDNLV